MKLKFLTLFVLLNFSLVFSQNDKTVTLTVSAQGQTLSEAKQNALRDAIEQAFGTFISSNTEILNDELVKDEIVSVSNGNIQDYEVISEVELPNSSYAATLKATVSITKLTSFAESKGANIEFKGGLFAVNMMQQELNEKAELKAVKNIIEASKSIFKKSFDYSIEASKVLVTEHDSNMNPIYSIKPSNPIKSDDIYKIPLTIKIKLNENFDLFRKYFNTSMRQLSMSIEEIKSYRETGKSFDLLLSYDEDNKNNPPRPVYFRNKNSIEEVEKFISSFKKLILSFVIYNDIDFLSGDEIFSLNDYYNEYASEYLHDAIIIDYFRIYHYKYGKNVFPSIFGVWSSNLEAPQSAIHYIYPRTIVNPNPWEIVLNQYSFNDNLKYNLNNKDFKLIKEFEANTIVLQERNLILNFYNFYSFDWGPNYSGEWNRNYIKTKVPEEFLNEKSIIWINFNDTKTLDEIKQISEYTIKPISD